MWLAQILEHCPVREVIGSREVDLLGLAVDSREVRPGYAFFAVRGTLSDGHDYVPAALASGATVLFLERDIDCGSSVTRVLVDDGRLTLARAAQVYHGDPTGGWAVVGVTGTNGKTTITYLLEAILQAAGRAPAVVGTINYRFAGESLPAAHTTPEPLELMSRLAAFRQAGADSLVMEVSSHALDQHRVDGIRFQVGIFTNLTPEHLDYHHDMENYFQSKCRLFNTLLPVAGGQAVINIDDGYGARLAAMLPGALTCGRAAHARIGFSDLELSLDGIRGRLCLPTAEVAITSPLLGDYNVENLLCAAAAAAALGLPPAAIARGLAAVRGVPGRLERIENDLDAVVLVDYAHTGDALRRVLETLQQLAPRRIVTVFGCGGDRDRGKRPVMGEVAASLSDLAIATSDNPRTEEPAQILTDVRVGLARVHEREWSREQACQAGGRGYLVIADRREAIRFAVARLQPGDLLLVAGKGHEDYQVLADGRIHFDDREELRTALRLRGAS
ncbi:MAG: UDP-N-acetylmuramoyl-L-alanyl-D-glutamate--2,6-diaminopimelate ligase [Desulfuromonadales bacterium]|nr:UDP-N-acetylmuramoyl-L-alanyl-D-glutamate--2,6-diaminopimelate ligase [Desulfuromonadales bacterium]